MMTKMRFTLPFFAVVLTASGQVPTFQHDVLPLFEKHCTSCHGSANIADLDLRTLDAAMKGGATGSAIQPGKPDASFLWKKISSGAMPLGGKQLTPEEKDLVRRWIEQGQFTGSAKPTEAGGKFSEKARSFWAYQKPLKNFLNYQLCLIN